MDYKELRQETKLFLQKAMDIYSLIKDKSISRNIYDIITGRVDYQFTKLDKKILSLFIAGLLVDGNLKNIISEYDDIKIDDLLDFIGIKEEEIKSLSEDEYEEFFNNYFRLDLMSIINKGIPGRKINFTTPTIIIQLIQYPHISGSKVLDYYSKECGVKNGVLGFCDHPLFEAISNYTLLDRSMTKVKIPKKTGLFGTSFIEDPFPDFDSEIDPIEETEETAFEISEDTWNLLEEIKRKFIGQEDVAERLFYDLITNQQLAEMKEVPDGQRSIIFLDGPTGTGKTAITREIAEKLGVPFTSTPVTNYSASGYVGGNLEDILKELYKKAGGDLEKAQRGIVVIDEFDKIAYSRSGDLEMKRAVQQQLLDLLGGGKYRINVGISPLFPEIIEFDTSRLTFVCLGALTDLRSKKTERKKPVGFVGEKQESETEEYSLTPEDLIEFGLESELVGRFNTYLHTDDYSMESLEKILRESDISPLIGFKKLVELRGKKLEIEEGVYRLIAEKAYELNLGARSLQTIVNMIRDYYNKELLRGTNDIIYLDCETLNMIYNQTMSRKVRS